jgi:hypothetical protein
MVANNWDTFSQDDTRPGLYCTTLERLPCTVLVESHLNLRYDDRVESPIPLRSSRYLSQICHNHVGLKQIVIKS